MSIQNVNWLPKEPLFSFRGILTQAGAGGGALQMDISPGAGNRMEFINLLVGQDNYAADRSLSLFIRDSNDANMMLISGVAAIPTDNESLQLPALGQIIAVDNLPQTPLRLILSGNQYLLIRAATPVQNETLTVAFSAFVSNKAPTIDVATNSAGTPSLATTTSEFV